ncbi:MAG: T9SS type A sorting domain-containing protein [Bacteroidota bacterium]
MKKLLLSACLFASLAGRAQSFTTITVQDSISTDTHWTCDKQYLLKGYVYVTSGATLTIDSGTIIRGDKDTKGAIIVERGAKMRAMGTQNRPIVFTSNQDAGNRAYGDWGGVILCGKAPTNWNAGQAQVEGGPRSFYGGTDPNDNSGEMHYVRIEFGGIAFSPNNEVNSLTLAGVGAGTQIDHIQVSYGGDDGFEWFGGTVNAKYLVSLATWDDDFDSDAGFQGKVQFGAIIRDPYAADNSGSKGFESDSYLSGTYSGIPVDNAKLTRPVFSNITAIGPLVSNTSTAWDPYFTAGAHIRRGSAISILNSVIAGWPCGLLIDESSSAFGSTTANINTQELQFRNNIIAGTSTVSTPNPKHIIYVKDGARSLTSTSAYADTATGTPFAPFAGPLAFLTSSSFGNRTYNTSSDVRLSAPFNLASPGLWPTSTSPISFRTWTSANGTITRTFNPAMPISYDTTGDSVNFNVPTVAPEFTSSKANDPFFTRTNYIGGFAGTGTTADNWMRQWCNFDPNNTDYNVTCYVAPVENAVADINKASFGNTKVFPNPANGVATLLVEVKETTTVKVFVTDLTGKVVMQVYNGIVNSGNQSFDINTSELSNGVYTVTIASSAKTKTVKLSVIK